ncbi:hypothetical protein ACWEFJ_05525 [Actinosynnema sp. NPDC004786]
MGAVEGRRAEGMGTRQAGGHAAVRAGTRAGGRQAGGHAAVRVAADRAEVRWAAG